MELRGEYRTKERLTLLSIETQVIVWLLFQAFASWKDTTVKERSVLLRKWFSLCETHKEDLAKLLTSEQGKPLAESRGELGYSNGFLEWFAEEARRIYGEVVPAPTKGKKMVLIRQPIGVAALITPWNFPAAMITRKVITFFWSLNTSPAAAVFVQTYSMSQEAGSWYCDKKSQ